MEQQPGDCDNESLLEPSNHQYSKTKDILYVKQLLGHRNINSTMTYIQLVNFESDEYHVRVARNIEEDKELVEGGFEYVTERNSLKIYRKRK